MNERGPNAKTWLLAVSGSLTLHLAGLAGFGTWAKDRAPVLMPQIRSALRPVRVALADPVPAPRPPVVAPQASAAERATARPHPAKSAPRANGRPRDVQPPPPPPAAAGNARTRPPRKVSLPPEAIRPVASQPPTGDEVELVRPSLPADYVIEAADAAPSPGVFDFGTGPGDSAMGHPAGAPGGVRGGVPGGVPGGTPGGDPGGSVNASPGGDGAAGPGTGDASPGSADPSPPPPEKSDPPPAITPARPIATPPCDYPEGARRRGHCGAVKLRIHIKRDGRVGDVEVIGSAGDHRLDEAAVKVVREEWRFTPARQGDVAIEATCVGTVNFVLD